MSESNKDKFAGGTSLDMKEKNAEANKERKAHVKSKSPRFHKTRMSSKEIIAEKYDIKTLKKDPFEQPANRDSKVESREQREKDARAEYNKLSEEEKKKFVIKAKLVENQWLDKKDQHELSHDDEVLAGVAKPIAGEIS